MVPEKFAGAYRCERYEYYTGCVWIVLQTV